LFDAGATIAEAHKKVRGLGFSTVGQVHTAWQKRSDAERAKKAAGEEAAERAETLPLPGIKRMAPRSKPEPPAPITADSVHGGAFVQDAGTWLVLGMLARLGLYEAAERVGEGRVEPCTLRVALDAAGLSGTLCNLLSSGTSR
jgi:hypothetical protein